MAQILNVSTMEMRCATKHQELEQHIGNLTALMELKSGQDEQARCQEEQQTKLIDVLCGLIEVQGKQLMCLVEDYEKRLDALVTNQVEAAETVSSLESNFTSAISEVKDRLDLAEDRLGKLQIQQEVLGSTHETLNSEVTEGQNGCHETRGLRGC